MNTQKHTPGPWSFVYVSAAQAKRESVDDEGNWDGMDGGGANGCISGPKKSRFECKTIAFLPHHRDAREDEERGANARLIAASPELLDALLLIVDTGFPVEDEYGYDHWAISEKQRAIARAAIAKAMA
jgi:hypothetical protein